jgi:hypothetical protein
MNVEADSEGLVYRWDWTRAEHIRLHKALLREVWRRGPLRTVRAGFFLVIGVASLVLLYNAFRGDLVLLARALPWLLLIGFWSVVFTWMLPRSSARAYMKLHQGPLRLALTAHAVESGCEICSNQLRWSAFQRAVETPEFFLLFFTSQCACFLPKRVLQTPEEQERVRIALRTYLPEQAPFATS